MKTTIVQKKILYTIFIIIVSVLLSILVLKTVGINHKMVEGMLGDIKQEADVDKIDNVGILNTVKSGSKKK